MLHTPDKLICYLQIRNDKKRKFSIMEHCLRHDRTVNPYLDIVLVSAISSDGM